MSALEVTVIIFIQIVAVWGNLFVLWVIYRNRSLRTVTDAFVVNLALTDLGSATICMTLHFHGVLENEPRFRGANMRCRVYRHLIYGLSGVSLLTMAGLALNRYYRVVKSSNYQNYFSKRRTFGMIMLIWIFEALIVVIGLMILGFQNPDTDKPDNNCLSFMDGPVSSSRLAFSSLSLFTDIIPAIIIAWCYFKIYHYVRRHNIAVAPSLQCNTSGLGPNIAEVKTARVMLTVVIVFCCCWLPAGVLFVLDTVWPEKGFSPFVVIFIYVSSATNPAIYTGMIQQFRREFRRIIHCKWTAGN